MFKVTLVLLALVAVASCVPKGSRNACDTDSDCRAGKECCFRRMSFYPVYEVAEVGECGPYLEEGQNCYLATLNGCGCRQGLACWSYAASPWEISFDMRCKSLGA